MTTTWLAADYHFPSTYSCRIPMSSMSSATAMPAPGPATVRLALIRTGIEYLGSDIVRDEIFPALCFVPIRIQPPERVGISAHRVRSYKWEKGRTRRGGLQESITVREMAHATEPMTIYIEVPSRQAEQYHLLLRAIGYWGQTDSLTYCVGITERAPKSGECIQPLRMLGSQRLLAPYFSCVASELSDPRPSWEEVTSPHLSRRNSSPLQLDVYVWPLVITRQSREGKLLLRRSLEQ
jgi:hypothetical protein